MCVVLLFLLRIVIRLWTQHARQDLKMLNAMKLINRKKRLQETRKHTETDSLWTRGPQGKCMENGGDPKNMGRQIPELPVDLWAKSDLTPCAFLVDFVDGATTTFFWAVID